MVEEVEEMISQLEVLTFQNASHLLFLRARLQRPRGTPFSGKKRGELQSDHVISAGVRRTVTMPTGGTGGSSWKKKTSWLGCKDFWNWRVITLPRADDEEKRMRELGSQFGERRLECSLRWSYFWTVTSDGGAGGWMFLLLYAFGRCWGTIFFSVVVVVVVFPGVSTSASDHMDQWPRRRERDKNKWKPVWGNLAARSVAAANTLHPTIHPRRQPIFYSHSAVGNHSPSKHITKAPITLQKW